MPWTIAKWALRAALVFAAGYVIWYGYDQVASAFRDRKQLRYDLERTAGDVKKAGEENERVKAERNHARSVAVAVARFTIAEIKARDAAIAANEKRAAAINKELTHAQRQLSEWSAAAEPDLARCLAMPLPDWLFDGAPEDSAGATGADAGLHLPAIPADNATGEGSGAEHD